MIRGRVNTPLAHGMGRYFDGLGLTRPAPVELIESARPLTPKVWDLDAVASTSFGHGINVPATSVLFAETTKFDGEQRRDLLGLPAQHLAQDQHRPLPRRQVLQGIRRKTRSPSVRRSRRLALRCRSPEPRRKVSQI